MLGTSVDRLGDLGGLNADLGRKSAEEILIWAESTFSPSLAVTSSFQTQGLPLLHMVSRVAPDVPVVFIDTGFHFPETISFCRQIASRLNLDLRMLRSEVGWSRRGDLYNVDPDLCCFKNKIQPFLHYRRGLQAWISGLRRDQTPERAHTPIVSRLDDGTLKICPLVAWSDRDVSEYIDHHDLPRHPLTSKGYPSVGCQPCTQKVPEGDDPRAGRWPGSEKTECGLHSTNSATEEDLK